MSKWTNATLTADGQNLQAQLLDGGGFEFTKVTAADSSGTDKLTLTMQPSVIDGQTITVPVLLSNSNLSAGFTMNQLKFYARKTGIPAGDEIVYAIAEDETGDEIPSESDSPGFTIDWSYTFQFGNATSVNVSIDPAGLVSMALLGNPGGIATLNNAGAVPIEQGGTGAVTASAALAALGGMRASATGDDIPTSASDSTSISSQLSNTALSSHGILQDVNILDWAITRKRSGAFTSQPGCTGVPNSSLWYAGNLFVNIAESAWSIILIEPSSMVAWYNATESGVWKGWKPIATATPPQEFDLPLASGWSNYGVAVSRYSKDQFGQVSVIIDITNAGAIASGSTVATLPAGFRPANPFDAPAIISNDPKGVGKCYFRPNGEIAIAGIGTASWDRVDYFTAQASFVASS